MCPKVSGDMVSGVSGTHVRLSEYVRPGLRDGGLAGGACERNGREAKTLGEKTCNERATFPPSSHRTTDDPFV